MNRQTTDQSATAATPFAAQFDVMSVLHGLSNPVMVADPDMTIRFVNAAATRMFEAIESDIRRDLPDFNARDVVGKPIDLFHRNPAYQRNLMADLAKPHDGKFTVGGRRLAFRAIPHHDAGGRTVGLFVEWQDLTAIEESTQQIDRLLAELSRMSAAHKAGQIHDYMDESLFTPVFRDLVARVNEMVRDHIATKRKIITCAEAFARGDFDHLLERFTGERVFINEAMDGIRDAFRRTIHEIQTMSHRHRRRPSRPRDPARRLSR